MDNIIWVHNFRCKVKPNWVKPIAGISFKRLPYTRGCIIKANFTSDDVMLSLSKHLKEYLTGPSTPLPLTLFCNCLLIRYLRYYTFLPS
jgi:hypothetical protein